MGLNRGQAEPSSRDTRVGRRKRRDYDVLASCRISKRGFFDADVCAQDALVRNEAPTGGGSTSSKGRAIPRADPPSRAHWPRAEGVRERPFGPFTKLLANPMPREVLSRGTILQQQPWRAADDTAAASLGGVRLRGRLPSALPSAQVAHQLGHLSERQPDLRHGVALPHSDRVVLHGRVVKGDPKRDAQLVVPRVLLADRGAALVDGVREAQGTQLGSDIAHQRGVAIVAADPLVQGQNGAPVRRDLGSEGQDPAGLLVVGVLLLRPRVVDVLQHGREDAVDPKRGLDHAGREGVHRDLLFLLFKLDQVRGKLERLAIDVHVRRPALKTRGELLQLGLRHGLYKLLDRLPVLLEGLHDLDARLLRDGKDLHLDGLVEGLPVRQIALGRLRVRIQIEGRSVSDADALQPPERTVDLGVPAVRGVVRHLCGKMLAEPNVLLADSYTQQEEVRAADYVAEELVVDNALRNRLADGHEYRILRC
mmetsp:Transcript_77432/g.209275  ORF Transcript_77432/g.209275 Transcript_77432/m.209275 type:complete len:480 (+) Transcript_77432:34-1473(+)